MKVAIFTGAEDEFLDILPDYDIDMWNRINYYPNDAGAIAFFEKKYSDYFDIVEIPEDATDYEIFHFEDCIKVIIVQNGKMVTIYTYEY